MLKDLNFKRYALAKEFEDLFPHEETEDQLKAIKETKKDMESTKVMDRLVCGDVGMERQKLPLEQFLACMDNKQVAVLVPTTILAQQHYNTFKERFENIQ